MRRPWKDQGFDAWLRRHRKGTAWGLFGVVLLLLVTTLTDPGITFDEPQYFASAQLQVKWVETLVAEGPAKALDRETVWEMWDWEHYYNPHPPLYKEGMALTWWATNRLLGPLAGFRLFPALCFAALVALAFRWGVAAWSGAGGLAAAGAVFLQPRLFGHAHLGATETPLLSAWMFATAAGWWAIERDRRLGWILAGVGWGFAAGSKFTGLVALVPLFAWGLWRDRSATVRGVPWAAGAAVVVFVGLNPLVWTDPGAFFGTWFWESLHRADYAPITTYYMGRPWGFDVPWHHVFVMVAAVTPLPILVAALYGAGDGLRKRDPLVVLAAGSVGFVFALLLAPGAPHHNGVRQFIVLFPFLGMLVGYAIHRLRERLDAPSLGLVAALAFVPPAVQQAWVHPYYLEYYGGLVGGVRGAHERGFETTYWMDVVTEDVFDWIDREIPEGAKVLVLGQHVTLQFAQAYGRVKKDIEFVGGPPADYYVVPMNQFIIGAALQEALRGVQPLHVTRLHGVPLVKIFALDGGAPPQKEGGNGT